MSDEQRISIGALAERTGLSVSSIRYYESERLVFPTRNSGGHRRFLRGDVRRLSFVLIAQRLGFTIGEIRGALEKLPRRRTPTAEDWSRIGRDFRRELNTRIETLTRLRDQLEGCIGCGCLSLESCSLYNPGDRAARRGAGPRYLIGDRPHGKGI